MTTDDKILDAAFAAARAEELAPSEALMNRIMLDADSVLAQPALASVPPRIGLGAMFLEAIGGWRPLSGLAAATVAGVWIGVAVPESIGGLSAGLWGETVEVPLLESDIFAALEG